MTLSRSVLITYPLPKVSQVITRNYGWGSTWGTVEMLDPAGIGYLQPYRTDGVDTQLIMVEKVVGIPTRRQGCDPANLWWPFCSSGVTIDIKANKGYLPQTKMDDFMGAGDTSFLCPVTWNGVFAYYLFKDPSLDDVCNPGGFTIVRTHSDLESEQFIYKPKDSYSLSGTKVDSPVVSGTTALVIKPYWEVTGSGIGFYKDTAYMKVDGFVTLGPNSNGDINISRITGITSSSGITVTEILYPFAEDDPIYYWTSEIKPEHAMPISQGLESDSYGFGGAKETEVGLQIKGGMSTSTIVETFIPLPWAIPAPYSIRNVPQTNIWLRLDDPSIPFNLSTLVFKVNGVNVTDAVAVTLVQGGIEMLYNPPVNFEMSSRVYVDVSLSCSPSTFRYFGKGALAGSEYITVSGGELGVLQPGAMLKLGPNPDGEWEMNTLAYTSNYELSEVKLGASTEYEYATEDLITYTFDDYPVHVDYYFDIVDDFRPPYFEGIYPYDGMESVARNQWIMFDIKDEGLGVDISTLALTVDNMIVIPQVYKYSDNWYRVVYIPSVPYYYNATVCCFATVKDLSSRQNRAFATWNFHTESGELPFILNPHPYFCAFPVHLKSHLGVDLFAKSAGANLESMIFTWDQHQYKVITYPKIYRPHKED